MEIIEQFGLFFNKEDKEGAVKYILNKLQSKEIDVFELYNNILTPSLNHMVCKPGDEKIAVLKEHVKTGIVRTILECSYPYVLGKREELNMVKRGTAVLLCPPDEYHDIGARMAADYFTIAGYETIFVGSNTPYLDVYNALHIIKPEVVAISVSNYYNLTTTKKMIKELKQISNLTLKILVGGYAFNDDENKYKLVGADYYVKTFEDIIRFAERGVIA